MAGTTPDRAEALSDLIGGFCYALLRSFEAAAAGVARAPALSLAERQAAFALDEFERFRVLRARLTEIAADPDAALEAFRDTIDAFYDAARTDDWLEAQVFHFVGDTITSDVADLLAPNLDPPTAEAVRRALTGRLAQQTFALEQITAALDADPGARGRIARFAGVMVGEALNRLRDALLASDALETILDQGGVKDLVLEVLGRHRERLERLGLDEIE